jgi:hypothetical protein
MYQVFIIIIVIILFITLFFYYKDNKPEFLDQIQANHFLVNDDFSQKYLNLITSNKNILKSKTDGGKSFRDYLQLILDWQPEQKKILTRAVFWINTHCLPIVNNFKWKFILISDRLEKGMPFTLGDAILIPESLLTIKFKNLVETLCHEKHHVLQRQYRREFTQFIVNNLKFRIIAINNLPTNQFFNPDGLQVPQKCYIIKVENKWYCPLLILTESGLQKILYRVDKNNLILTKTLTLNSLKDLFPTCPPSQLYHPNEILAELGSKYMLQGTCGDKNIDGFFNSI